MERRREKRLFVGREERREKKREEGGTQSSNQLVHFLIPATRWNSIKLAKLEGKTGNSVGRSLALVLFLFLLRVLARAYE